MMASNALCMTSSAQGFGKIMVSSAVSSTESTLSVSLLFVAVPLDILQRWHALFLWRTLFYAFHHLLRFRVLFRQHNTKSYRPAANDVVRAADAFENLSGFFSRMSPDTWPKMRWTTSTVASHTPPKAQIAGRIHRRNPLQKSAGLYNPVNAS
jgi:hypothetical protein